MVVIQALHPLYSSHILCCFFLILLQYLKTLSFIMCLYCLCCFCAHLAVILSAGTCVWAIGLVGEEITCVSLKHKAEKNPHPLSQNRKSQHIQAWKQVTEPPPDCNWRGCVCLCVCVCVSVWHTYTHTQWLLCFVYSAQTHVTRLRAHGWCLCFLMCNSSQSVVHEARAIYRSNGSLCRILCLWRLWSQFSLGLPTRHWDSDQVSLWFCWWCTSTEKHQAEFPT